VGVITTPAPTSGSIVLPPGETCPHCGLRRPKESQAWTFGDGDQSYVPIARVRFVFIEIVNRIGTSEAARRMGISRQTIRKITNLDSGKKFVERGTARKAMLLLRELRQNNVAYARSSIKRGALARGEKPRSPARQLRDRDELRQEQSKRGEEAWRKRQRDEEDRLISLTGY